MASVASDPDARRPAQLALTRALATTQTPCRGRPEFISDHTETLHAAALVCRDTPCPVLGQCLEAGLEDKASPGVWGGRTPSERHALRSARSEATQLTALPSGKRREGDDRDSRVAYKIETMTARRRCLKRRTVRRHLPPEDHGSIDAALAYLCHAGILRRREDGPQETPRIVYDVVSADGVEALPTVEAARAVGLTQKRWLHAVKAGLITPRFIRDDGTREYDMQDLVLLRALRAALELCGREGYHPAARDLTTMLGERPPSMTAVAHRWPQLVVAIGERLTPALSGDDAERIYGRILGVAAYRRGML